MLLSLALLLQHNYEAALGEKDVNEAARLVVCLQGSLAPLANVSFSMIDHNEVSASTSQTAFRIKSWHYFNIVSPLILVFLSLDLS